MLLLTGPAGIVPSVALKSQAQKGDSRIYARINPGEKKREQREQGDGCQWGGWEFGLRVGLQWTC